MFYFRLNHVSSLSIVLASTVLAIAFSDSGKCRADELLNSTEPYVVFDRQTGVTFEVERPATADSTCGQPTGRILVNFKVEIPLEATAIRELHLTHVDSGRSVPFQTVATSLQSLRTQPIFKIYFFANLQDETQTFHLSHTLPSETRDRPKRDYALFRGLEYRRKIEWDVIENGGVIDNGKFSVRVPLARRWNPYVQGPIDGIGSGGRWHCRSHFNIPDHSTVNPPIISILESGPLFARYEVKYNPSIYQRISIQVTHILGYDYVIIDEAYNRLNAPQGQSWALTWDSFMPDRIHTPNGAHPVTTDRTKANSAEPLARIIPPNAPLDGWPNVAFEDDSGDHIIALFALESSRWRTESHYGLADIGVRARLAPLNEPPEKDYGPLARVKALANDAPFEDKMRYPYRADKYKGRDLFQVEFPLDNGFRRTALAYIPRSYLKSPEIKRIPSESIFADFMSGTPKQSSTIDHHLQRMRLQ
ncbi:MAG: hypothetical protein ACI9HK_002732, partial [Pirellulaceae bacterium]